MLDTATENLLEELTDILQDKPGDTRASPNSGGTESRNFKQLRAEFPDRERETLEWLSEKCGLPFLEAPAFSAGQEARLAEIIPANEATRYSILPLKIENGSLFIAASDPFNFYQRAFVQKSFDGPIEWSLSTESDITNGIQRLYGVGAETFDQLLAEREGEEFIELGEEENVIDETDDEASVVKFVNQIIRESIRQRATDIHIEPLHDDLRIRYRIDGVLRNIPVPQRIKSLQASVIARIKVMAQLDIAEKRLPQDGRIRLKSKEAISMFEWPQSRVWKEKMLVCVYWEKTNLPSIILGCSLPCARTLILYWGVTLI